jgi:sugar (glycoside-pentoside-hexuronide) transporter
MKVKLGYGAGGLGAQMIYNNFILWAMIFFTDFVGFGPAFAGTIIAVGTLWDAITDPTIGYLSDKLDPEKGRRRSFIRWFFIPLGIISCLLFTNFGFSETANKVYFVIVVLAFYTLQTLIEVPYSALGAEITQDYDERTSLGATRNLFYVISMLLSNGMFLMVFVLNDYFNNFNLSWSVSGAIYGVLIMISLWVAYKLTEGYELKEVGEIHKFSFKTMFGEPLKNKTFRYVTAMFALAIVGLSAAATTFVYYFMKTLGFSENGLFAFLIGLTLVGFISIPFADYLSKKFSKKVSWIVNMTTWAAAMIIFPVFIFKQTVTIPLLVVFALLMGIGFNVIFQIIWSMIPDCVEVDELKTGKRREGMYYGVISFIQKLFSAIAILIVGVVLEKIGYDPSLEVLTPETLNGIANLFGFSVSIPVVLAVLVGVFYPMSRSRHALLMKALELKKSGKQYSTEGMEDIL